MKGPRRARRRPTLRTRLLLALLLVAGGGIVAFGVLTVSLLHNAQLNRIDAQLDFLSHSLTSPNRLPPPPPETAEFEQLPSDFRLSFFDSAGTRTGTLDTEDYPAAGPELPPMDAAAVAARGSEPFTTSDTGADLRWRVRTVVQAPTEWQPAGGTVAVAAALEPLEATVGQLRTIELAGGAILLLLMSVTAAGLIRVGLAPLTRIERTAQDIAAGQFDRRVEPTDPHTEVGRLGLGFNVMLGAVSDAMAQLTESEQRMRNFVADASHELRTPLTSVRGYAELYRRGGAPTGSNVDELMARIEAEAIRMSKLVNDMLLLARFDQERPLDLAEIDLPAVVADAVRSVSGRVPHREITIAASPGARIVGDQDRIRRLVTNLVDNAVVHSPAGAAIAISIRPRSIDTPSEPPVAESGGQVRGTHAVVLDVTDDGPGIAADKAPYVFDRFYRAGADPRTAGSGLGLAIVAAIAAAHSARVQLVTRAAGGTTFRVLFAVPPAARDG